MRNPSRWLPRFAITLAVLFGVVKLAPEALAWPHKAVIGDTKIYSVAPIPARAMRDVLATSDELLRASTIHSDSYGKRLFLTDGGWRWQLLSIGLAGAKAHSSPLTEAIVVNRNSIAGNWVRSDNGLGGRRSLSSIIAHERTHGLIRARYGLVKAGLAPQWKVEGYCDFVAGETSLSAADVLMLEARGEDHPAIPYFEGEARVRGALVEQGQTADRLFE
jgi:hypothetical protein